MSDKLCPFCGGSECYSVDDYGDVSVACLYKTHGDTWNTRPLEDAANARAEAAEARANKAEAYAKKLEEKIPETNLALAQTSLRAEAAEAKVAALQAELIRAIDIYKDPAVAHANILNGRIVLPKFYVNITDDFGPVADLRAALDAAINMNIEKNAEVVRLTAALAAANEDAERLFFAAISNGYCCQPHAKYEVRRTTDDSHAADCPITLHRARVGAS